MTFSIRPALTEKQTRDISTFIETTLAKEVEHAPKQMGREQVYRIGLKGLSFSYEALVASAAFGPVKDELNAKGWDYRKKLEDNDDGYTTTTVSFLEIFAPLF